MSRVNSAFASPETIVVPPPVLPVEITRAFVEQAARRHANHVALDMGAAVDDEADAYRGCAVRTPEWCVVAVIEPDIGQVLFFEVRGHNFGLEAAVLSYNAKAEFLCVAARRLFTTTPDHYFDDFSVGGAAVVLG